MLEQSKYYWIEEEREGGINIELSSDLDLVIDPLALGMLQNNIFEYLLPVKIEYRENKASFHYFSPSLLRLENKEEPWDKRSFLDFLKNLRALCKEMDSYFLDPHTLALEPGLIFFEKKRIRAIALPYQLSEGGPLDLGPLLKGIVISSRFDRDRDSTYLTNLLNQIHGSGVFDLKELEIYLQSEENFVLSREERVSPGKSEAKDKHRPSFSAENNFSSAMALPSEKGNSFEEENSFEDENNEHFLSAPCFDEEKSLPGNSHCPEDLLELDEPIRPIRKSRERRRKKDKKNASSIEEEDQAEEKESTALEDSPSISFFYLMRHFSKKNLDLYKRKNP